MIFKRVLWFWIAIGGVVINVAGGAYASLASEPMHAFVHGAFAVGLGLWARYLRPHSGQGRQADKVQLLEENLSELQQQLNETQQRLDFADQLLRQRPKSG